MSMNTSESNSNCSAGCKAGQERSEVACPDCGVCGVIVSDITPRHTLKKDVRKGFDPKNVYNFCENPDCGAVYYSAQSEKVFYTEDLINRVTIKDGSPATPLCYCFKVLKKHALEEIARTGTTDVVKTIQSKMKHDQECFCEKSNPRGGCCISDIEWWLEQQGIQLHNHESIKESGGTCCG